MAAKPSLYNRIVYSFQGFEQVQVRSGTFTLIVALLALSWLNSPWGDTWRYTWETPLSLAFWSFKIAKPLSFWIQHALMALFFLVIGLELKRVLRVGELTNWRDAAFPLAAAIGGMLVPAGLYLYLGAGSSTAGWTTVTTADVAAALALLALASSTLPLMLRVFLSTLAISQATATLLLSTVLYASIDNLLALSVGTGVFGLLVVLRALRNRTMWLYLLAGLIMLGAFVLAGISGAVAGVLLALVIPVHSRVTETDFVSAADTVIGQLHALRMMKRPDVEEEMEEDYQAAVHTLRANCNRSLSPLRRLQQRLLPWAGYLVLPLFAIASAPFAYNSFEWRDLLTPVPLGVFIGLALGKPIGILLFAWLAVLLRIARIPANVHWVQLVGAALLAGAGFMLSVFQAQQTFTNPDELSLIKISVLAASAVSATLGVVVLALAGNAKSPSHGAV